MNFTTTLDTYEQEPVSSERALPATPFPRNHIHCAISDLRHAVFAVLALCEAGIAAYDIHVLASWDFIEAVGRRDQALHPLRRLFLQISTFFDEVYGDLYLHAALQGQHILAVRIRNDEQKKQVPRLLASYHAHLMKYVDSWVMMTLSG